MKIIALLCAAVAADCVHAAGVWDGGSGDGPSNAAGTWTVNGGRFVRLRVSEN